MAPTPNELLRAWEARRDEQWYVESFYNRMDSYENWRGEWQRFDSFLRGEWFIEYPDGTTVQEKPRIENRVRTIIEDKAKLAAQTFPTMRVEAPSTAGQERAMRREQAIQFYHQLSATKVKMPLWFADQIGVGLAVIEVMPEFSKPKEQRFPLFKRLDPRDVLPPPNWQVGERANDVIVHEWHKVRELMRRYPDAMGKLIERSTARGKDGKITKLEETDEVLVIRYYDDHEMVASVYADGKGGGEMLWSIPNRAGRNPVILVPRPTADGRIRGQFGDVLPALAAENRVFTYMTEYIDQAVYSPIIKRGMPGQSIDWSPGAIIDVPNDADISRAPPAQIAPEAFRVIADLERASRRGAVAPEARSGDIPQSIGSAAFVESLMGGMITDVQGLQQQMEHGLEQANEVAQLQDRVFCDARKSIIGYAQGGQFKMHYRPSELIREGDISNIVSYGAGSGLDRFNRLIMLQRIQGAGWGSRRWAAIESGVIDNYLQMQTEIDDETALDALRAGILQQAAQGNLEPLARWREAKEKNINVLEVMSDIVAGALQPAPSAQAGELQPPGLPGEATPGQQAAAAQTGAPGGGTALPPLAGLLTGG